MLRRCPWLRPRDWLDNQDPDKLIRVSLVRSVWSLSWLCGSTREHCFNPVRNVQLSTVGPVHCTLVQWWCRHQVNRPLYHRRQLPLLTVTSITPLTDVTICWAQPMRRLDCVQLTNPKPALTRCDIWPTDHHLIPIFPGLLNIPRWHNTPMLFLC